MSNEHDYMREEILFQDVILEKAVANIEQIAEKFSSISIRDFDELWLTGSGDSHCASIFGAFLFEKLGIKSRVFTPMDLSNFTSFSVVKRPLLIAISVSGKTPRVLEVVRKFKKYYSDPKIIGLTDNPESPIYKESTIPILINASPSKELLHSDYEDEIAKEYTGYHHDVAQTKSYFANLLMLTIFAYQGNLELFSDNFRSYKSFFHDWMSKAEDLASKITLQYPHKTIFVSSGILRSIAQFGQYKWFEFTLPGMENDIEEYAHTHYFTTDSNTSIVFFAPEGPLLNRAKELIDGALGKLILPQILLITDIDMPEYESLERLNLINVSLSTENRNSGSILKELEYYFSALIYLEWLVYYTANQNGFNTSKFRGGVENEKYVAGSLYTIRKSKINDN